MRRFDFSKAGTVWCFRALIVFLLLLPVACVVLGPSHGWSPDHGPVLPHDSFPADCSLCHVGGDWHVLREDFSFDHEKETGVALRGAHKEAQCLRCHNDRGPVQDFAKKGCAGCHEDVHRGRSGRDCQSCHGETDWRPKDVIQKHNATRFPLLGAHAATGCFACHAGAEVGNFEGADIRCHSCHTKDMTRATSPNHMLQGWTKDCQTCHTPLDWRQARFAHPATFPLTGSHSVPKCADCHKDGRKFVRLSVECANCHLEDYKGTKNPNHAKAGFFLNCKQCHSTTTWRAGRFQHSASFPLNGGHAAARCADCHKGGSYKAVSRDCYSCHQGDYHKASSPNHKLSGYSTNCQLCHGNSSWRPAKAMHPDTFPLIGSHASLQCADCHKGNSFRGLGTRCVDCHQSDYTKTSNPKHALAGFGTNCTDCHDERAWRPSKYKHKQSFPLTFAHAGKRCDACHKGNRFTGTSRECSSCHMADYQKTKNPKHSLVGYKTSCQQCHSTKAWRPARFSHPSSFPLRNAHASARCTDCHKGNNYKGLSTACASCHQSDYAKTQNPPHAKAKFSTACQNCHGDSAWRPAKYTHTSKFPLQGAHAGRKCADCHSGGKYVGLSSACVSCHQAEYSKSTNPPHALAKFPTNCQQCHGTSTWRPAKYTHTSKFPLTGAHAGRKCSACHTNGRYVGLPSSCVSCHLPDYNKTTNPNHKLLGYTTTCQTCHNTSTWKGAKFTHTSKFPLRNKHAQAKCADCHKNNKYQGLNPACVACHQSDYAKSKNPPHALAKFPNTCQNCHGDSGWRPAKYTHTSKFPLTGAHAGKKCSACHTNGRYVGLPSSCVSCHLPDYNKTTNPNHKLLGYTTTCQTCHNTSTWKGAKFTHTSKFPLRNKHAQAKCIDCHKNNKYQGLNPACVACHQSDYTQSKSPPHAQAKFPTACQNCHNDAAWRPATFTHTSKFPLNGAHKGRKCTDCHSNGRWSGLPSTCVSCHLSAYNKTTNPNHKTANFPTSCQSCHGTSTWKGAKFNHKFPITKGHHKRACTECHKVANNYKIFSCTHCHEHRKSKMDSEHKKKSGYQWLSAACYRCHPNGKG